MTGEGGDPPPERDDGLRRLLTWTFVALVAAVALSAGVVLFLRYYFEGRL